MSDEFERMVSGLRTEADANSFAYLTAPAVALGSLPRRPAGLRNRAAAVTAALTLAFGGVGGVAYAADGAAPGDLPYGIDRALERVGIGRGEAPSVSLRSPRCSSAGRLPRDYSTSRPMCSRCASTAT